MTKSSCLQTKENDVHECLSVNDRWRDMMVMMMKMRLRVDLLF